MRIDEAWNHWVGKSVQSILSDKLFEVTSLDWDDWDRPLLYCEERIDEDLYAGGEWFHVFEVREL